jgi:hypothetical protein
MREKSLGVHREYGNFRMFFLYTKLSSNTPKVFKRAWRTRLKNTTVFGDYTKSILLYMENTPIDIKRIFDQIPKES